MAIHESFIMRGHASLLALYFLQAQPPIAFLNNPFKNLCPEMDQSAILLHVSISLSWLLLT